MADKNVVNSLMVKAEKCRLNVMCMLRASGHGHIGGAFSSIDIVTALYFYAMHVDALNPNMEDRDRFLLSAGHKCMAQYAVLAEKGFFKKELLNTYGGLHSKLPGHPDMHKLPGVEANTGALGHGLSIGCGMALGLRQEKKNSRVFVIMGDGELPEGSNWEAAAAAAHYGLSNLVVFVDNNGLQISGRIEEVMKMTPVGEHFRAFGWAVKEIDGNNMEEIIDILDDIPLESEKPTAIIAHTVKCKGLSQGEGKVEFHYWMPTEEEIAAGEKEIENRIEELRKVC